MKIDLISPGLYTYGSLVLGGILKNQGHEVTISKTLSSSGDATLISLFSTLQLLDSSVKEFVTRCNRVYVGGPVALCPEMVLGELEADAVIVGEGEEVVAELVEKGSEGLPGAAYKKDGKIIKNPPKPVTVLDHPLPLIPKDLKEQNVRGANVYIETHRGCLGGCTFCQVSSLFGHTIRSRSIENVIEEVKEMKQHGIQKVSVSGGTGSLFGYRNRLNKDEFIRLLFSLSEILGKRNLSVPDMRVDLVDEEVLKAIKEYTIGWVFFGLETGSERILKLMKKGVTVKDSKRAIELAKSLGVKVGGSFIVGYPTETKEDFKETLNFMEELALDDVFISIAEPIPGTPLAKQFLTSPKEDIPQFQEHQGEYRALKFSEAEARCFELMLHGEICKSVPRALSGELYQAYLTETKNQGKDISKVMALLEKYKNFLL